MNDLDIQKLTSIVGQQDITQNPCDLLIYATDATQNKGTALAILWPATTQQISQIIEYANKKDLQITPRGAGTSLTAGAVPENSIILDLSKMDKITQETSDTITVEAGTILDDLNTHLAQKNKYFPVIPSSDTVATIGGMLATNAAGTRAIKYGRTADWTEEIELITGKGSIIKTKDIREFAGTEGILAIITKATLKTTTLPKQTSITTYEFNTAEELTEKVKQLKKDKSISAIEYLDPLTSSLQEKDSKYRLFIEYENNTGTYKTPEEIEKAWKQRKGLAPVLSAAGYPQIEDPRIPLENIPTFLNWLKSHKIPNFGHIGYGIIHCRLKPGDNLNEFYTQVKNHAGEVSGEHGIGLTKKQYIPQTLKDKLKEKKQKYDPKNILNRGKMI